MEKVLLNTELYWIEDDDSATFAKLEGHTIGLENGKTYTVTLDSGTYEVECQELGEDARIIGIEANFMVMEITEDGNAFVFVADYNYGTHIVISTTVSDSETISTSYVEHMAQYSDVPYFDYMSNYVQLQG